MEDVGTVLVHVDALDVLAIDVAAKVRALVYHKASLALPMGEVCECGTEQAGANYQIVIFLHMGLLAFVSTTYLRTKLRKDMRIR